MTRRLASSLAAYLMIVLVVVVAVLGWVGLTMWIVLILLDLT